MWEVLIYMKNFLKLFMQPEYLTLIISVITIIVTLYISDKNRKSTLKKELYFKQQQIVEEIVSL